MAKRKTKKQPAQASTYTHKEEALQRPDVGVQQDFKKKKPPKTYRYDSSLDPALAWDENAEREKAEWLLNLIAKAAEQGEDKVFVEPQRWAGGGLTVESTQACVSALKTLSQPFLNWAGKAERHEIEVPTLPLFVHERHSTKAILDTIKHRKPAHTTLDLFGDEQKDVSDRLSAYEHKGPWTNRMILGDSLQVMNSLLEYEGLGGQVQMIYMDPPYGVKFGSNFQPFVRRRDVTHGKDDHMVREPEMIKAYRDTWELGMHSYLSYMRDRLLLARELLSDTGSVFVQISDETLTNVRALVHEIFGEENYLVTIIFKKKSATQVTHAVNDYILWAAKDAEKFHPTQIYYRRPNPEEAGKYKTLISPDGEIKRAASLDDDKIERLVADGWRWARTDYPIVSQHPSKTRSKPYFFDGRERRCGANNQWRFDVPEGLDRLAKAGRLFAGKGDSLGGIVFWDDWPYVSYNNVWTDLHGEQRPSYVVQTNTRVVERCMLMASEPGDLVLDPTCGSGTTAYVSEYWGRRWITIDTSRVPIALARQRLLTSTFPWHELKEPSRGPSNGFVYERRQDRNGNETGGLVPQITLKSIANNEEPRTKVLVDQPEVDNAVTRVTGPFTVEATTPTAMEIDDPDADGANQVSSGDAETHIDRMVEVLRQSQTLHLPGNRKLNLEQVRRIGDTEHLHAEASEPNGGDKRMAIVFGPEDGAITSDTVYEAASEARFLKYDHLYFFAFAIQAKARELLEDRSKIPMPCTYVYVTPDVVMSDLLKTTRSSEIFSVTGLPELDIKPQDEGLYQVEIKGLDLFHPAEMKTESIDAEALPCWMLDTDYNGFCFYASQVFFPKTSAWDNLKKSMKASFEDSVWAHLAGTESEPFAPGDYQRIAVKVIDERGNELMVVKELSDAG